jgi:hypothetical protein
VLLDKNFPKFWQGFLPPCYFQRQSSRCIVLSYLNPEYGGRKLLRNVDNYLSANRA